MNRFSTITALLLGALLVGGCGRRSEGSNEASRAIRLSVSADFETEPVKRKITDDAADDPAFWINPKNVEESRIIGTDKKGGLVVYDMQGKELFYYADGKMNNVDIRYNFPHNGEQIAIVGATNRTDKCVDLYKVNEDGSLKKLVTNGFSSPLDGEVYGFCFGKDKRNNTYYAFANSKDGEFVQWEFRTNTQGIIEGKVVRSHRFPDQTEGMVSDDATGTLFVGVEPQGIWHTTIRPNDKNYEKIVDSDVAKNPALRADIEGLAIYRTETQQYLLASSQGNYSYAVFDLNPPYSYLGSFKIADGTVDAVEETDGIAIVSVPIGEKYPEGILIAQDGFNKDEKGKSIPQNFKVVNWQRIRQLIDKEFINK